MPLGPGMSLVLQTSQGFLQSGVRRPWEVLYRLLIKTICVKAIKAIFNSLGPQREEAGIWSVGSKVTPHVGQ